MVDILAQRHGISFDRLDHKAVFGVGKIAGKTVMLIKPQTFMNRSGESLLRFHERYGMDLSRLMVAYDDIDLPAATVRVRGRGSAGTHNGMRSVIYSLKSDGFARTRVGIGKPEDKEALTEFVLSVHDDKKQAFSLLNRAADAVEEWIGNGIEKAQEKYH